MQRDSRENGLQYNRIGNKNLLNPKLEEEVLEDVTFEELSLTIEDVSDPYTHIGEKDCENKAYYASDSCSPREQLKKI